MFTTGYLDITNKVYSSIIWEKYTVIRGAEGDPRWPPLATVSELLPPLQLLFSSVMFTYTRGESDVRDSCHVFIILAFPGKTSYYRVA